MTDTEFEREVPEQGEAYEQRVRSAVHVLVVPNHFDEALAAAALLVYGEKQGEPTEFWITGTDALAGRLKALAALFASTRSKMARHLHLFGQDPRGEPAALGESIGALAKKHFEVHWYLPRAWERPEFEPEIDWIEVRESFVEAAIDRWVPAPRDRAFGGVLACADRDSEERRAFDEAVERYRMEGEATLVPDAIRSIAESARAGSGRTPGKAPPRVSRKLAVALLTGESAAAKALGRSVKAAAKSAAPVLVTGPSALLVAEHLLDRLGGQGQGFRIVGQEGRPGSGSKVSTEVITAEDVRKSVTTDKSKTVLLIDVDSWSGSEQERFASLIQEFQWGDDSDRQIKFIGVCAGDPSGLAPSLFYTLGVAVVRVPDLRERVEDIPRIREQLLAAGDRSPMEALDPAVKQQLQTWPWPGNYDELFGVLNALRSGQRDIGALLKPRGANSSKCWHQGGAMPTLAAIEQEAVRQAKYVCGGNVSKAARMLRISRSTLRRIEGRSLDPAGEPTGTD